ncbi:MAG TPA: hypothetical protein DG753_08545 [Clostridium sp.]|nr:hypothetical protein [Clostridium sp.]
MQLHRSSEHLYDPNYFIWIEKDEYYKKDLWNIREHKYFFELTEKQRKAGNFSNSIDFSICNNENLKNEIKNALAYMIENRTIKINGVFHDKYIIVNIIKFINKEIRGKNSFLEFDNEQIYEEYEKYLKNRGLAHRSIVKRVSADMTLKKYVERNKAANLIKRIYDINKAAKHHNLKENLKDVWDIRNLDISVSGFNSARPRYTINFEKIYQPKIREVVKKYEYERLKNSKYSTIIDDLKAINLFSKFLYEKYPAIEGLDQLTRDIVLEFLGYVEMQDMCHTTKGQRKGCLRVFLNLIVMYGWEYTPKMKLLHKSDYGKKVMILPKPISLKVLKELNENIRYLPEVIQKMVFVIQNIGMRVNELCRLKIGSVKTDKEGDYFLEYYQSKVDKFNRIPIKKDVAQVILNQEEETLSRFKDTKYIFTRDGLKPIGQESFSYHINRLAFERNITDEQGNLYRFKSHHFRHTVATGYVNNGMNPNMIRMMLGHRKMKSIMSYIELRDATVIDALEEVFEEQNKILANLNGNLIEDTEMKSIDLVNGMCTKISNDRMCEKANKCYQCSMFYFCNDDVTDFKEYLNRINENIDYAEENGFSRMVEINKNIKNDIEKLIN